MELWSRSRFVSSVIGLAAALVMTAAAPAPAPRGIEGLGTGSTFPSVTIPAAPKVAP